MYLTMPLVLPALWKPVLLPDAVLLQLMPLPTTSNCVVTWLQIAHSLVGNDAHGNSCHQLLEHSLEEMNAQRPCHPVLYEAYTMSQQLKAHQFESQQLEAPDLGRIM